MGENELKLPRGDIRDLMWLAKHPRSWGLAVADPDIYRWERLGLIEFRPAVGWQKAGWAITSRGAAAIRQEEGNG